MQDVAQGSVRKETTQSTINNSSPNNNNKCQTYDNKCPTSSAESESEEEDISEVVMCVIPNKYNVGVRYRRRHTSWLPVTACPISTPITIYVFTS